MAWAKRLLCAVVALGCLTAWAADTYGKSSADIVKMGRSKWFAYYTGMAGESTLQMCEAERIYGSVLVQRNDRLIKTRKLAEQTKLKAMRKHARAYSHEIIVVGRALSGGGTIWQPVSAGVEADVEEMLEVVLGVTASQGKAASGEAAVYKTLAKYHAEIVREGNKVDEWGKELGHGRDAALKSLDKAKREFALLFKTAKGLNPKAAKEAVAFGLRQANDIDLMR